MFRVWLEKEKNFSTRGAQDVVSRVQRVQRMIKSDALSEKSIEVLNANEEFLNLSTFVRSQLRRAVRLYMEYEQVK